MVDLETLGNTPGCGLVSIGACTFGPGGVQDREQAFYSVVDARSCLDAGLHEDASTLAWWARQSAEAQAAFVQSRKAGEAPSLKVSLGLFTAWLKKQGFYNTIKVWGNGSDFDNAILACAWRAVGVKPPWAFWHNRCFRTLKAAYTDFGTLPERKGTHHNALDDALYQAECAVVIIKHLRIQW